MEKVMKMGMKDEIKKEMEDEIRKYEEDLADITAKAKDIHSEEIKSKVRKDMEDKIKQIEEDLAVMLAEAIAKYIHSEEMKDIIRKEVEEKIRREFEVRIRKHKRDLERILAETTESDQDKNMNPVVYPNMQEEKTDELAVIDQVT